jgi:peroxiredoxin
MPAYCLSDDMSLEGTRAPDFELPSTAGGTVRLSEALRDGPAVVVFNRGPWCRYCAEQLTTFTFLSYHLRRLLDVDVLPVLSEPVPELVDMRDRWGFGLQLLSDTDFEVIETYTDTEENDDRGRIPVPATFVVDESGTVRYEHVATRPDDRTYANYVRQFVQNGFEDPYPGEYPDPYTGGPIGAVTATDRFMGTGGIGMCDVTRRQHLPRTAEGTTR